MRADAADPAFQVPAGQRQLFLDDYGIVRIDNLTRTMHQPEKRGAVIRPTQPETWLETRCPVVWDPQQKPFKTWLISFITYPPGPVVNSYATSPDGLHWSKPVLGRYEVLGSTQNNFVAYGTKYDHVTAVILNVVHHPDAPLASRVSDWRARSPSRANDGTCTQT